MVVRPHADRGQGGRQWVPRAPKALGMNTGPDPRAVPRKCVAACYAVQRSVLQVDEIKRVLFGCVRAKTSDSQAECRRFEPGIPLPEKPLDSKGFFFFGLT